MIKPTMEVAELERVLAMTVDERYAYAINEIRERGELWTLKSDDGWVVSTRSSIPVWPAEAFARLEASGAWANAEPSCVSLGRDWLTDERARWFLEREADLVVFLVGSESMRVTYSTFAELLRGSQQPRYSRGRRRSGKSPLPKRDTRATRDLVSYVDDREIALVLGRVPDELRVRVRDVFRKRSSDARRLGSVTRRGRRDIELSTLLPIRVSLRGYMSRGHSASEFGGPDRGQWPPWAVRRYLLYNTLLHEIGHLQVVDRDFASETRAQEFAAELRRTMYSDPFDHPDPIHNAPTPGELATLELWTRLDKARRADLVTAILQPRQRNDLQSYEPMTPPQRAFLSRVITSRGGRRAQ